VRARVASRCARTVARASFAPSRAGATTDGRADARTDGGRRARDVGDSNRATWRSEPPVYAFRISNLKYRVAIAKPTPARVQTRRDSSDIRTRDGAKALDRDARVDGASRRDRTGARRSRRRVMMMVMRASVATVGSARAPNAARPSSSSSSSSTSKRARGRRTHGRGEAIVTRARKSAAVNANDKKNKKNVKRGKSDGKNAKTSGKKSSKHLKPPTEGTRTLKIGSVAVDVPEGIPRALEQAPRPVVYAGGALALLILKKLLFGRRSGSKGSLGDLEERGMLDENREVDEEKFFKGMMKSVRTVEMPELTEEQILAARERRRASAAGNDNFEKSLSEAEIPANHPWATKEKLTPEEERAAEQRVLEANRPRKRRGVPPPQ
jgi:hypothetical protein